MEALSGEIQATLERLAAHGIELLPMAEVSTHYVVARDGFVAMVERRENGAFGSSGNPGKLTSQGLALFVRQGDSDYFIARGLREAASPEESIAVRRFAADLKAAVSA